MRGKLVRVGSCLICLTQFLLSPVVNAQSVESQGEQRQVAKIEFTTIELMGFDGEKVAAETGWLKVPENRSKSSARTIELPVVRFKSKTPHPGSAIFYLAGGPGGASTREAFLFRRLLSQLQQRHDIVLMDQRGTGRSKPSVIWAASSSLPPDSFSSYEKAVEVTRERNRQAIAAFRERGIDLTGYNSVESADDLNDLRLALGASRINLIGFSYGTHLGLSTIRRHAAHLDSVVLVGTEGPNHTLKLPSTYDAQLRKLSDLAAQDPAVKDKVPDMFALFQRILARLEKQPIVLRIHDVRTKQPVDLSFGKFGMQMIVRMDVGDGNDFPEFPALFNTIDKGDYSVLKKYVEKRYNQFSQGVSGMSTMMDLFSGVTAERLAQIKRETPNGILGEAVNFPDPVLTDLWGNPDLGDDYRSPILTSVRTLFVSGTLDSNTPPYQAEEVRWGFSNSTHLLVEFAGHEDMLPNQEVEAAILDFFAGKDVGGIRVSLGKPRFKPIP